jgi:aryl-alcohol dehydrogenase-like predicted oxidoreductase
MFDTAEAYAAGNSEQEMQVFDPLIYWICCLTYIFRGRVIKELGFRRTDLIISTKLFWSPRKGPNDAGLSRKQCVATPKSPSVLNRLNFFSIVEGTQESLARLGLDYVDIIFAHRPDHSGTSRP